MIETIKNLFDVNYGQHEYESKENLDEGRTILIASGGVDNGIYGFFDVKPFYKAPFITVPRTGSIGQAFVQQYDCCANSDVLVLIPKDEIRLEELYQVAYQIRRFKWKFSYGRKITPERIATQKIRLIANKLNYDKFIKRLLPRKSKKIQITENRNFKLIKLNNLCDIQKKTALPQNALEENGTPYVTTTSKDNGVSNFVNEEPNTEAKCLTVALNGSVGETFFQFDDFITSGDNAVLTLKANYNPYLLFYIGAMIKNHRWKYNYYRKLNLSKLNKMTIPMPCKNNNFDIDYIKQIVENSYGFEELKKYL